MGDNGGDLRPGHAVGLRVLQVIGQGGIRDAGRHQGNDRNDASGLRVDDVVIPHFPEQNVVVEMGKQGREFAQLPPARGLHDLFFHNPISPFHTMRSAGRGDPPDMGAPAEN